MEQADRKRRSQNMNVHLSISGCSIVSGTWLYNDADVEKILQWCLPELTSKFGPYLEDAYFFSGERQLKEVFQNFLARKETQKQELEAQTGVLLDPLIGGRILFRQTNLTDHQQANLALIWRAQPFWSTTFPEPMLMTTSGGCPWGTSSKLIPNSQKKCFCSDKG